MKLIDHFYAELVRNNCEYVQIAVPNDIAISELMVESLDLKLKTRGHHCFGPVQVPILAIVGPKETYRRLGLLLILRGLCHPLKESFYIKTTLRSWTDVNALCLGGGGHLPRVSGLEVGSITYRSGEWESPPIMDTNIDQLGLPGFRLIDTKDKKYPPDAEDGIPGWVEKAICMYGTSTACLFLGKMLLDFSRPNNIELPNLRFDPMNRATMAASYIADFWLEGSFGDDDAYS